jgi:carbon storage regulator
MLVVTRKINERIFIGNDICVQIVNCHGNQVRIGIDAPKSCLILREEVKDRINGLVRQNSKKLTKKAQTKGTKNQTAKRR